MKIKKSTLLWIVIGVLFLVVLWMTFNAGNINVVAQGASTAGKTASASGSQMVGGC